ncbi:hypothetical protein PIB30_046236 [Stylosanthes scabra]|uniref:Transcription factor Iwr1 domain-containing protein n=1 Tax=Stylosanthes scabra TaxID=79078 RepID=A0ABU6UF18_9FABA|nr:hypothetical protein [Stylosanthes scabra]
MEDIASDDEWYVENLESSSKNEEPELYDAELIIPTDDDTPKDQYDGARFAADDDAMGSDGDDQLDDYYDS